ncbi:MAG TPA: MBG domain-containing protein, partial [Pseudomonadales bacterium]|nr:MBG domain-containing protein [Pseudomonadales bacterium]
PGSFAYTPAGGTVFDIGVNKISAIFTPVQTANSTNITVTNSVNLTVLARSMTVTAANTSRIFGRSNPVFTGTITGLTNNDNITATYSCSATVSSPPGIYPIVPSLADPDLRLKNYSVITNNGTLTIYASATDETMTWTNPLPITYGTALTATQLNAIANVPGAFVYTNVNNGAIISAGSVLNAGTNVLTVLFTPADTIDYTNITASVKLVVTPAPLAVTTAGATRAYGQNNPVFNGSIIGLTNGDIILLGCTCVATNNSPAGTYPIVPVLKDPGNRLGNYAVTTNEGALSVVSYVARGASVPWSTYEAENMYISGGAILGPDYGVNTVASESSGRECVQLNATGQSVEFVAQGQANAIVVRYSVPDNASGTGANYTLSLYTNGVLAAELPVTSMYSWLYGSYPFSNTPGNGSPRNFYDEVRFLGLNINPGDVVQLQKGAADTAAYYDIDLVDLENAAPLTQPGNSLSIITYNADPTGNTDSTTALENCIAAAQSQSKSVWVPSGTYQITSLINLPSNITIQGAGMWYSTFTGNASLYSNSSRRVTFNGNGSNIHLSDFAITGKLNYRNDNEPNDGLGGSFGTGSSIQRIWVEHTKTGAWLENSLGLLINGCRFRDTLADGCNVNIGMKSTTITNCTARGGGDDCFAVWPTGYSPQTYTPGGNVFTSCTGELPFLANGGSLYGATNNAIQNCLFQDITYGCGILISTTFPITNVVSGKLITNSFGGITLIQNCDVVRSGGEDPNGGGWRGAIQLCLQTDNITGINLLNLNITNSMSDGLDIISPGSGVSLSSTVAANVTVANYGLGTSGRQGIWAESGTHGSMLVSNSIINGALVTSASVPGILNSASPQFTFLFSIGYASSTINTTPAGLAFMVDGTNYNASQTFNWLSGSIHTLSTPANQTLAGIPYQWYSWSDGGLLAHSITATGANDTAIFGLASPSLTMSLSGAGAIIAWPTNALGFNLQSSTNLSPPAVWTVVPGAPSVVNGQNVLTNSIYGTQMYFRLSQ